jgi:hypothetical protein
MPELIILYTPRAQTPFQESSSEEVISQIKTAVRFYGWKPTALTYHPEKLHRKIGRQATVPILNLAYGYVDHQAQICLSQPDIAEQIESMGLSYIGSTAKVQRLTQDKLACSKRLGAMGIRIPQNLTADEACRSSGWAVRKPRFGACHRDVQIIDPRQIKSSDLNPDVLFQPYIAGPEYTVGIVMKSDKIYCFPPLRIVFKPSDHPCIIASGTAYEIAPEPADPHGLLALSAFIFRKLEMRDYARIDYRVLADEPVVLDVNSLPNLHPQRSFLPIAATAAGWTFNDLIAALLDSWLARARGIAGSG